MLQLDADRRMLVSGSVAVRFTPKETMMVHVLASGRVVPLNDIISAVWRGNDSEWARIAMQVVIHKIRKKTIASGLGPVIANVRGRGFYALEPIIVVQSKPDWVVPGAMCKILEELLWSHPDKAKAERLLASMVIA